MLRQSCRGLHRSSSAATTNGVSSGAAVLTKARQFSTEVPTTAAEDSTFVDAWKKILPNLDPPKTPSVYMKPRPATPTSIPTKLTVNLALPYSSVLSSKEWAALNRFTPMVHYIIEHGGDVNAVDNYEQTALHWAAIGGSMCVAKVLLKNGARIEAADVNGYRKTWTGLLTRDILILLDCFIPDSRAKIKKSNDGQAQGTHLNNASSSSSSSSSSRKPLQKGTILRTSGSGVQPHSQSF